MILESLIIGLCVGGYECNAAPKAYYKQSPGLQSYSKAGRKLIKTRAPFLFSVLPAVTALSTSHVVKLPINRDTYLSAKKDEAILVYGFTF